MFYDWARVYVRGGDGGNGVVAFRREKYVPRGGPSGGDGGNGGNVIFKTDSGLRTLVDFKYQRHYRADRGRHGEGQKKHGKGGSDLVVRVPVGTVVRDINTRQVLFDMIHAGQEALVARGGRGGRGNARFASAQNRTPGFAEHGEPGEEREIELELKLLADVGLVGFPNVGKSTIISRVSAAKPKIAEYPFTTLVPNLGTVRLPDESSFVLADIPGLIEGAHEGLGLGHTFLRHIERTRLLIHVLDISESEGRDALEDFKIINGELIAYSKGLEQKTQIIAANKMDIPCAEDNLDKIYEALGDNYEIFPISAVTGKGINALLYRVGELLTEIESSVKETAEEILETIIVPEKRKPFEVKRDDDGIYIVTGNEIEKHVIMTDLENEEAVRRLQMIFNKMGLEETLRNMGIKEGDTVRVGKAEFDFFD